MSQAGVLSKPDRRVKLIVSIQVIWMATLVVLILWWGTLLRQQSDEIANLQAQLGVPEPTISARLERTERMIAGESGTFVLLILVINSVLVYLFVRDSRRARSIQAFFASITHELRTPLTSIKLQAEALQDIEDDPKHQPFIKRLLEDVERLEGQVQRSLELARIEGGGKLTIEPIQLRNFIQTKILSSYQGGESRVSFDVSLADAFVNADPTALTIIFRNVIDNAIKYSSELPARIKVQGVIPSQQSTSYLVYVIHTNSAFEGDTELLGQLFERGRNSQGAGVGLYLIRTLVHKMGGKVAYSARGGQFIHQFNLEVDHGH
ncbi:MAG: HAMP domain-containing histidine kinase [Bdellovibrionales bacterium]|nr:HAMP domain-containing histidine kinase [Bdellovibrionales bacterium]